MLTHYFSCCNLKPTPFKGEKNSPKLKDCQIFFIVIKVFRYSNICVHYFQKEKMKKKLSMHSGKKLVLIIVVQRLHSITTYVGCYSSLNQQYCT